MKHRKLGRTDIEVSVVAMGCWAIVGDSTWGEQDAAAADAALLGAVDAGITFFDTAEAYGSGRSEEIMGRVLAPRRKDIVIASKAGGRHLAPDDIAAACERSLSRLKTDYIDLYQIHWPSRTIPLADTMGALERLREQGKIRAIGVSNFGPLDLDDLNAAGRAESNQLNYSLLFRAIEFEIMPTCVENEIGILCYSPMCQGLLTGKFASADDVPEGRARTRLFSKDRPQSRHDEPGCEKEMFEAIAGVRAVAERVGHSMADVSLAWVLAQPGITSVLAGARSEEQVRENAKAGDLELDAQALSELDQATAEVKRVLGANADMWQTTSRLR
jgi:aryl-alcohol dehydrogenase-like predicted oxidoreductase